MSVSRNVLENGASSPKCSLISPLKLLLRTEYHKYKLLSKDQIRIMYLLRISGIP